MGPPVPAPDLLNVSAGKSQRASQIQHSKFIFPTILLLFQCRTPCKLPSWRQQHAGNPPHLGAVSLCWLWCTQQYRACLEKELDKYSLSHLWPLLLYHSPYRVHFASPNVSIRCPHSSPHCRLLGLLQWSSNCTHKHGLVWSLHPASPAPSCDSGPLLCSPSLPATSPLTSDYSYLLQGHGTGCSLCLKSLPHSHSVANSHSSSVFCLSVTCTGNLCLSSMTGGASLVLCCQCLVLCSRYYSNAIHTLQISPTFWNFTLCHFAFTTKPTLVPVFANQKKSKENFYFYKKKKVKGKNSVPVCFAACRSRGSAYLEQWGWHRQATSPCPGTTLSISASPAKALNCIYEHLWFTLIYCVHPLARCVPEITASLLYDV